MQKTSLRSLLNQPVGFCLLVFCANTTHCKSVEEPSGLQTAAGRDSAQGGSGSSGQSSGGVAPKGGQNTPGGTPSSSGGRNTGGTSPTGGRTNSGGQTSGGTAGSTNSVFKPFSADSPWNMRIPNAPGLDPESTAMIADLAVASQWPFLSINIQRFSIPFYWVDDTTPKVEVKADVGGTGFKSSNGTNATAIVPVPTEAEPDAESDHHLLLVHRNQAVAWDFWNAARSGSGWTCGTCAQTDLLATGVRLPKETNPTWYTSHGSRACGFPLIAGLIRVDEIKAGHIDHALVIAYPHIRAGLYTPPASTAQAKVGTDSIKTRGIPCGGRIQLDPNLNLDSLALRPAAKVIARALQEYGAYVGDYSGSVSLYAENQPSARTSWAGLLDEGDLREKIKLNQFQVLKLGKLYDDHNGD